MSITGNINELHSIKQEIDRLSRQLRELRQKKKTLEENISKFIEQQEKPGIKYKGNQFLPKTKQIVDRKRSTKTKEEDAGRVLQKYGISEQNSQTLVKEMLEAMRGPRTEETALLIKKIK
jgi:hypothetical protein